MGGAATFALSVASRMVEGLYEPNEAVAVCHIVPDVNSTTLFRLSLSVEPLAGEPMVPIAAAVPLGGMSKSLMASLLEDAAASAAAAEQDAFLRKLQRADAAAARVDAGQPEGDAEEEEEQEEAAKMLAENTAKNLELGLLDGIAFAPPDAEAERPAGEAHAAGDEVAGDGTVGSATSGDGANVGDEVLLGQAETPSTTVGAEAFPTGNSVGLSAVKDSSTGGEEATNAADGTRAEAMADAMAEAMAEAMVEASASAGEGSSAAEHSVVDALLDAPPAPKAAPITKGSSSARKGGAALPRSAPLPKIAADKAQAVKAQEVKAQEATAAPPPRKPSKPKSVRQYIPAAKTNYNLAVHQKRALRQATKLTSRNGGVSFHPETRKIVRQPRKSGAIDLATVGNTHRVYENAKETVMHRAPSEKPMHEDGDEAPLEGSAWLEAQWKMTEAMNAAYGASISAALVKPKQGLQEETSRRDDQTGEYVPKPRRTQRAKQNTARKKAQAAGRPAGLRSDLLTQFTVRMSTARKKSRGIGMRVVY